MKVSLLQWLDAGRLLGLWLCVRRAYVAKNGRVDATIETRELGLIGLVRSSPNPIVTDRLVRVKL